MPKVKKKIPRKKIYKNKLPADLHEYFLYGYTTGVQLDIDIFDLIYPLTDEAVKKLEDVWDAHRADIMKEWIKKEGLGSRPFFWWEWESPDEPRKRIGGKGITPWDAGKAVVPHYHKGVPNTDLWLDLDSQNPPVYESEASYLQRHNLLTKEEREILSEANGDFKPQTLFEILGEK